MAEETPIKKDVPSYAFLQSNCIEIKVSLNLNYSPKITL